MSFSLNFGAAALGKHCAAACYPSIHLCTLKKMIPKAEMAALSSRTRLVPTETAGRAVEHSSDTRIYSRRADEAALKPPQANA